MEVAPFNVVGWLMGLVAVLTGGGALAAWRSQGNRIDELEARELKRAGAEGALSEKVATLDARMARIENKLDRVLERRDQQ